MNTENKSDDARTDQRDKYLRAIIDTTKDAFFVIGEDEKIVDYNQAFLKITGLSRKEAQQIHLYDIVPPSESLAKIKNAERLLNTGSVLFEGFIKKKDGSIVDVELTTTLYSDKPFIVVCFARDITERKNAAKSLQNMHDLMQYIVDALTGKDVPKETWIEVTPIDISNAQEILDSLS
jgi:PAS domain S-box-containing protein